MVSARGGASNSFHVRFLSILCFALLAGHVCADPVQPDASLFHANKALFDIPATVQARFEVSTWEQIGSVRAGEFSFKSLGIGYATGIIIRPDSAGIYPVILAMHGLPQSAEGTRAYGLDMVSQTESIFIALNAPFARTDRANGEPPGTLTYTIQDRHEQIQLIRDWRTIISLLPQLPYADSNQIVYFGVSYGATMGGILTAIESRITAFVLSVGDGGLVTHDRRDRRSLPTEWIDHMLPIEPIHYVAHALDVPILLENGEYDQSVAPEDALFYQQTVSSTKKEMHMYPLGHRLSCDVREHKIAWMGRHVSLKDADSFRCRK